MSEHPKNPTTRPGTEFSDFSTGDRKSSTAELRALSAITAIVGCWPATKIDEDDKLGVWLRAVGDLSNDRIKAGIEALPRVDREFAPSPGQFRELCIRAYRPPEPERPPQIEYHSEKQKAWRFVQGKYSVRITFGLAPNIPNPDYMGDFDWEYVVLSAKYPVSDSLTAHQAAWDALRTDFETEWSKAA